LFRATVVVFETWKTFAYPARYTSCSTVRFLARSFVCGTTRPRRREARESWCLVWWARFGRCSDSSGARRDSFPRNTSRHQKPSPPWMELSIALWNMRVIICACSVAPVRAQGITCTAMLHPSAIVSHHGQIRRRNKDLAIFRRFRNRSRNTRESYTRTHANLRNPTETRSCCRIIDISNVCDSDP
jgi:hypothetical protein